MADTYTGSRGWITTIPDSLSVYLCFLLPDDPLRTLGGYATSHKQVLYQYDLHVYPPEFIDRSTFLRFESISGVHHCLVETDSIVGRIRRTVTVTVTVTAALGTGHWQYVRTYEKLLRRRARGDARAMMLLFAPSVDLLQFSFLPPRASQGPGGASRARRRKTCGLRMVS